MSQHSPGRGRLLPVPNKQTNKQTPNRSGSGSGRSAAADVLAVGVRLVRQRTGRMSYAARCVPRAGIEGAAMPAQHSNMEFWNDVYAPLLSHPIPGPVPS